MHQLLLQWSAVVWLGASVGQKSPQIKESKKKTDLNKDYLLQATFHKKERQKPEEGRENRLWMAKTHNPPLSLEYQLMDMDAEAIHCIESRTCYLHSKILQDWILPDSIRGGFESLHSQHSSENAPVLLVWFSSRRPLYDTSKCKKTQTYRQIIYHTHSLLKTKYLKWPCIVLFTNLGI